MLTAILRGPCLSFPKSRSDCCHGVPNGRIGCNDMAEGVWMLATDVDRHQSVHSREGATPAVTNGNESGKGTDSDEVLKALGELEDVLRENAENERVLFQRIAALRLARENGQEWRAILADEDDTGTVQIVSTVLRRQSEASGYLRRSLVVALRAEGQSIPSIAHLFGVTHQRVSNLLRRVAQGGTAA
jgi:hypothetical protein